MTAVIIIIRGNLNPTSLAVCAGAIEPYGQSLRLTGDNSAAWILDSCDDGQALAADIRSVWAATTARVDVIITGTPPAPAEHPGVFDGLQAQQQIGSIAQ